jgi:signal peptidase II
MAVRSLDVGRPVSVLGEYFQFLLVYNRGALFGFDPRRLVPGFPVNVFFYVFSAVAVVLLVAYYRNLKGGGWPLYAGIALIMPGALGNFVDRLLYPRRGVVDFVKWGISQDLYWPIFNFADAYITMGVILILYELLREEVLKGKGPHRTEEHPA